MEKDINELNLDEYEKYKEELIERLSQFESVSDSQDTVFKPIFRYGMHSEDAIDTIEDSHEGFIDLFKKYQQQLDDDGYYVAVNEDGYIVEVSEKLQKYQNYTIEKYIIKDKLLSDKYGCFSDFKISNKSREVDDILHIESDNINLVRSDNGKVDLVYYKMIYTKYLSKYLEKLSSANKMKMESFEYEFHTIKDALKDYDKYFKGLVNYTIITPDDKQVELPNFGGLARDEVSSIISKAFAPNGLIKVSEDFHNNNHLETIKGYSLEKKENLANTCVKNVDSLIEQYKNFDENKIEDKINLLLNAREYITAVNKICKTYNRFLRFLGIGKSKVYDNMRSEMIKKVSNATGISESDCKKFFHNKKPIINYKGRVFDYNKLFEDSKILEGQIKLINNSNKASRVHIDVNEVNEKGLNNLKIDIKLNQEIHKDLDVAKK